MINLYVLRPYFTLKKTKKSPSALFFQQLFIFQHKSSDVNSSPLHTKHLLFLFKQFYLNSDEKLRYVYFHCSYKCMIIICILKLGKTKTDKTKCYLWELFKIYLVCRNICFQYFAILGFNNVNCDILNR